jgi:serine/threonine protein phosphatase PrpC
MRAGEARLLTTDHTVAQAMRRAGTISPAEADVSPMRSVLSNAVGISPHLTVDHATVELADEDRLLISSDGLYDYFDGDELAAAVTQQSPASALELLIEAARERGGHDNITGVIVDLPVAASPLDFDDAPTSPISVPLEAPPQPLADATDGVVSALVEQALRESSQPHEA